MDVTLVAIASKSNKCRGHWDYDLARLLRLNCTILVQRSIAMISLTGEVPGQHPKKT